VKVVEGPLSGVLIIEPKVFHDARGFFLESYHQQKYRDAGINLPFVQDNHSHSTRHTLRGLHAQLKHPQGKLVRVILGAVLDVIVDIRPESATFKRWMSVELSAENFKQCYVPPGFAHGFYTLSETAEMEYKCTDFYHPEDELHLLWNDPDIGIQWPGTTPFLSAKDEAGVRLRDIEAFLPRASGTRNRQ
jgi:dTDP-4-dehydrorhamnose 3,5-epimerase